MLRLAEIKKNNKDIKQLKLISYPRLNIASLNTTDPEVFKIALVGLYEDEFYKKYEEIEKAYIDIQNKIFVLESKDSLAEYEMQKMTELQEKRDSIEESYAYLKQFRLNSFNDNNVEDESLFPRFLIDNVEDHSKAIELAVNFYETVLNKNLTEGYEVASSVETFVISLHPEVQNAIKNLYDVSKMSGKADSDFVVIRDIHRQEHNVTLGELHSIITSAGEYITNLYQQKWQKQRSAKSSLTLKQLLLNI